MNKNKNILSVASSNPISPPVGQSTSKKLSKINLQECQKSNEDDQDNLQMMNLSYSLAGAKDNSSLLNYNITNLDSANQSFVDRQNEQLIREQLQNTLNQLGQIQNQLESDIQKLKQSQKQEEVASKQFREVQNKIAESTMQIEQSQIAIRQIRKKKESQISTPKHSKILGGGGGGIDLNQLKNLGDKLIEMASVISQIGKLSNNRSNKSAIQKIWSNKLIRLEQNTKEQVKKIKALQPAVQIVKNMTKILQECQKNLRLSQTSNNQKKNVTKLKKQEIKAEQDRSQYLEKQVQSLKLKLDEEEKSSASYNKQLVTQIQKLCNQKDHLVKKTQTASMNIQQLRVYCNKIETELNRAYEEIQQLQHQDQDQDDQFFNQNDIEIAIKEINAMLNIKVLTQQNQPIGRLNFSDLSGNIEAVQSPNKGFKLQTRHIVPPEHTPQIKRQVTAPNSSDYSLSDMRANQINEPRSQSVCEFNNPDSSQQKRLPRYPVKVGGGGNFINLRRASWNSQPGGDERLFTDPGDAQSYRDNQTVEENSANKINKMLSYSSTQMKRKKDSKLPILIQTLQLARDSLKEKSEELEKLNELRANKDKLLQFFEQQTQELKNSWSTLESEKLKLEKFKKHLDDRYYQLKKERQEDRNLIKYEKNTTDQNMNKQKLDSLSVKVTQMEAEQRQIRTALENQQKNQEVITQNFKKQIETYKAQLKKLKQNINSSEKLRTKLHNELKSLQQQNLQLQKKRDTYKNAKERYGSQIQQLKRERREITQTLDNLKLQLKQSEKQKRKSSRQLSQLQQRRERIQKRVQTQQAAMKSDLQKINKRYTEKQSNVLQLQHEIERMENHITNKQESVRNLDGKLELMRKEIDQHNEKQFELRTTNKKLDNLKEQLRQVQDQLQNTRQAFDLQGEALKQLREEIKQKKDSIQILGKKKAQIQSFINKGEEQVRSKRRECEEKQSKVLRITRSIDDLENAKQKKQVSIYELQNDRIQKQASYNAYHEELLKFVKQMNNIRNDFEGEKEEINREIDQMQNTKLIIQSQLKVKEDQLLTIVAQIEAKTVQSEKEFEILRQDQEAISTQIQETQREQIRMKQGNQYMKKQVEGAMQMIKESKTQKEKLEQEVNQMLMQERSIQCSIKDLMEAIQEMREQEKKMIEELNYLQEKESLMQIKLAIGGEKMGKNIEAKIIDITQKAVKVKQLEKEVQNLQKANFELRSEVIIDRF